MINFNFLQKNLTLYSSIIFIFICIGWTINHLQNINLNENSVINNEYYIYPIFSYYAHVILEKYVGKIGVIIFGSLIFPFLTFLLLIQIFNRLIDKVWSVSLALLSVAVYTDYPFREFLIKFINFEFINNFDIAPTPLLFNFPIPSFSTFIFLICFYFATEVKYIKFFKISLITICATILIYINAIDAIFFICFWIFFIFIKLLRQKYNFLKILNIYFFQFIIISFGLVFLFYNNDFSFNEYKEYKISAYYLLFYLVTPSILIILLSIIQRIDFYEILFKFSFIYIFMGVEILLILIEYLNFFSINLDIMSSRISQFFLHSLYYVPVIYYSRNSTVGKKFGLESHNISKILARIFYYFFTKYNYFYLVIIDILIIIYLIPWNNF